MALASRRLWCSCTIINYLAGKPEAEACRQIIEQIKHEVGRHEIVVSIMAETEVVQLGDLASDEAEKAILEFFGRDYVLRANLDVPVAERTRKLVRAYGLKPQDALHVATALYHKVPIMETFDNEIIKKLNEKEGDPLLVIRKPTYEGPLRLL